MQDRQWQGVVFWGILGFIFLIVAGGGGTGSGENTAIADSYTLRPYITDFAENEYGTGQSQAEAKTVVSGSNVTELLQSVPYCLIVNGDFETGDLTGWTLANSGSGSFVINDGTLDPPGPDGPISPCGDNFSALTQQTGPGTHTIYQDVALSCDLISATLRWADVIRNHHTDFVEPKRQPHHLSPHPQPDRSNPNHESPPLHHRHTQKALQNSLPTNSSRGLKSHDLPRQMYPQTA